MITDIIIVVLLFGLMLMVLYIELKRNKFTEDLYNENLTLIRRAKNHTKLLLSDVKPPNLKDGVWYYSTTIRQDLSIILKILDDADLELDYIKKKIKEQ